MLTVTVRKQGGAAVMTIPADVLKMLDLDIGSVLELHICWESLYRTTRSTAESAALHLGGAVARGHTRNHDGDRDRYGMGA